MIITRFAPSPTNNHNSLSDRGLHVGGARTALYNWVVRQQKDNNVVILRAEDTDFERSNDECLKCIIRDFEWLGINFDAGFRLSTSGEIEEYNNTPLKLGSLRQSNRQQLYNHFIEKLLKNNQAYQKDGAIFFRMPKEDIYFEDSIVGTIKLPKEECEDFPIRKSSGISNFTFAMSCDDELMGVNVVIRGNEHTNSAPKQVAIGKALGFRELSFTHIPLLFNPDGSKMSKRQTSGQVNVHDFRKDGYLSEILLSYLAGLGWSMKGKEEFSIQEMIEAFSIKDIGRTNCRFDYKKLERFNKNAIERLKFDDFRERINEYGHEFHRENWLRLVESGKWEEVLKSYQPRCTTLKDVFANTDWVLNKPATYNSEAVDKFLIKNGNLGYQTLSSFLQGDLFKAKRNWTKEKVAETLKQYSQIANLSMNQLCQPIRIAMTGSIVSPPIDDVFIILGQEECKSRIQNLLQFNQNG